MAVEKGGPAAAPRRRTVPVLAGLGLALLLGMILSLLVGRYAITPREAGLLLWERLFQVPSGPESSAARVFFNLRLPRIFAACIVGGGLALSGCAYQGVFQNPMVSPDILGATAGAGFGAALALLLSLDSALVQLMSFLFGLGAVAVTMGIGTAIGARYNKTLSLVLTGMVVAALFQAGISLTKYAADPYSKLPAITFWLLGSLSSVTSDHLPVLGIPFLVGAMPLLALRWRVNLLSLSDEEALSMGVNVTALRGTVILCATLITSSAVAVAGIIGWVGLIIPHMARMLLGPDYKALLPGSALMGALYLLLVDDVARGSMAMEIPIGIITAVIGAPVFLFLIYRGSRS